MVNIIYKYLERYIFTLEDQLWDEEKGFTARTLKELKGKVLIKSDSKIDGMIELKKKRKKIYRHVNNGD